jgi:glycosyltransferase involved in cell wall biosynthesis
MKVSVVTPSFRQLPWLKLCVASVAGQVGVEIEHIVQDAGTGADLEVWAASQPNLRLFVERDAGMYDAINRGLRRATGEICAYLNCDEQYLPRALFRVGEFFTTHPQVDVLFGDTILVDQHGQPLSYRRTVLPTQRHIRLAHLNTPTCSTFFRHRLLQRGFYFDPAWKDVGDGVWVEELLRNKVKMATLPEPLAVFTFTGENRSTLPLASKEGASRRAISGPAFGFRRSAAVLTHRIRKAVAGAYCRRHLEIDIFTMESPQKRQHLVGNNVGFGWPSLESLGAKQTDRR